MSARIADLLFPRFPRYRRIAIAAVIGAGWALSQRCDAAPDSMGSISEKPLAAHAAAPGATMFSAIPPEKSGIRTENKFSDPKMRGELYQEFETSSIGTGIAIGDYDGDGLADVFVTAKTEGSRLFRNLGNWKFEDVTDQAGVADKGADAGVWKQGVTFVDVNNDGLLDIYICRYNAPNLLYMNQGGGVFKEQAREHGLDIKDSSVMAAFCDYDRDGWLDVYIATNILNIIAKPNGQRGYLLHNNRDGTFTNVTDRAGFTDETQSHSATWWDYDNDGWPDLYVANDYGKPDRLYHNNRDGTFTDTLDQVLPHTSFSSMGADLGDVNNDGLIDFLVADMAATTHFTDQHSLADARGRTEERPDNLTSAPKYHRNALLLNTGVGRCLEAANLANLAATDWTWAVRFEDLDNDGRLDLFVTNGFPRDPAVDVLKRMMNVESPAERIKIMYDSPVQAETNLALRNLGDLKFKNVEKEWGLDHKSVSLGAAFGDLTGDGNLSVIYSNYGSGVSVYRNDNDTGHRIVVDLRGTVSNRFGVGATVKVESALGLQVRQLVLARGYMSTSEPMLHFGLGKDTTIARLTVTWPSGHVQVFENLGVDRRFTITEPSGAIELPAAPAPLPKGQFEDVTKTSGLEFASKEEPVNEVSVQRLLPAKLNRRGPAIAVGALSNGAAEAIVFGGTSVTPVRMVTSSATGVYSPVDLSARIPATPVNDGPVLLFDANGDGNADLLVTKGGNSLLAGSAEYQPQLFFGDGNGGFTKAPSDALPPLTISAGAVAAADFDHDGKLDLFVGARVLPGEYPLTPQSALLINRGGKFEDVTDAIAPGLRDVGMVTSAIWSDVDGDGWSDLVVSVDWGFVKYFHNDHGKAFEDWTEKAGFAAAGKGWWSSLAAADFNGDGRPDFVAGNLGLNTQYRADAEHPAVIFSGDFKGDGTSQLVEAYYEGDKLYPWRSRRDAAAVFPSIMKRFPKNDLYARATLPEIYGEKTLAAAEKFTARELRSGVFMSQPDGTYKFQALPHIAQISPWFGVVTGDFDGDGHADIYAVQNSYAPIAAVGRFDGGLSQLLRGDGAGGFTPATPAETRLVVPGDAKALAAVDLDQDGWADFVVTRNMDTTLAFRNAGRAGHNSICIKLAAAVGNPTGIGSRIIVELADGSKQTAEVYAGSGYYSQSSAACFFGYPDANPPKKINVRWPDGSTSEQAVGAKAPTITVTQPAK